MWTHDSTVNITSERALKMCEHHFEMVLDIMNPKRPNVPTIVIDDPAVAAAESTYLFETDGYMTDGIADHFNFAIGQKINMDEKFRRKTAWFEYENVNGGIKLTIMSDHKPVVLDKKLWNKVVKIISDDLSYN